MMNKRRVFVLVGFLVAALFVGGVVAFSAEEKANGPDIKVEQAWGRPSPKMAAAGAAYMVIKNDGAQADKLISVETDVCETVELHESFLDGDVMKMRPVDGGYIQVPAGGAVELKPGGYHVMLIKLETPLVAGTSVPLTLVFEESGKTDIVVEIRAQ